MELIAEIGLNHRGDVIAARRQLDAVLAAGVRRVTFQVREPAFYDGSKPHKRPLPFAFYEEAVATARSRDAQLGFAVADLAQIDALDRAGAAFFKSLSWDLGNEELQRALDRTGKPLWISTGVSGIEEIVARARHGASVGFIHTQLSAAIEDQNVRAIETIRMATDRPVAFGLHCADHRVVFLALAMRPDALFAYVRESDEAPYPDGAHAIRIEDLGAALADFARLAPAAGTGVKVRMERKL
jgi:N-acetylneuraminate synthase